MWKTHRFRLWLILKFLLLYQDTAALKCYVCRYIEFGEIMDDCKLQECPNPPGPSYAGPACKAWLHPSTGYTRLSCSERVASENTSPSYCVDKFPKGYACKCFTDGCNDVRKIPCGCLVKVNKDNEEIRRNWRAQHPDAFKELALPMLRTSPAIINNYYVDTTTPPFVDISYYTEQWTSEPSSGYYIETVTAPPRITNYETEYPPVWTSQPYEPYYHWHSHSEF